MPGLTNKEAEQVVAGMKFEVLNMESDHPIQEFSALPSSYTKQVMAMPFDKLPLYVNHKDSYVKYVTRLRLKGSFPLSYLEFLRRGGT